MPWASPSKSDSTGLIRCAVALLLAFTGMAGRPAVADPGSAAGIGYPLGSQPSAEADEIAQELAKAEGYADVAVVLLTLPRSRAHFRLVRVLRAAARPPGRPSGRS